MYKDIDTLINSGLKLDAAEKSADSAKIQELLDELQAEEEAKALEKEAKAKEREAAKLREGQVEFLEDIESASKNLAIDGISNEGGKLEKLVLKLRNAKSIQNLPEDLDLKQFNQNHIDALLKKEKASNEINEIDADGPLSLEEIILLKDKLDERKLDLDEKQIDFKKEQINIEQKIKELQEGSVEKSQAREKIVLEIKKMSNNKLKQSEEKRLSEKEVQMLEDEISDLNQDLMTLDSEITGFNSEILSLDGQLKGLVSKLKSLGTEASSISREKSILKIALEKLKTEHRQIKSQIMGKLSSLEDSNEEESNRIEALVEEINEKVKDKKALVDKKELEAILKESYRFLNEASNNSSIDLIEFLKKKRLDPGFLDNPDLMNLVVAKLKEKGLKEQDGE